MTDASAWSTYENVVQTAQRFVMGIGFVLSTSDPFSFVNLDNPAGDAKTIEGDRNIIEVPA